MAARQGAINTGHYDGQPAPYLIAPLASARSAGIALGGRLLRRRSGTKSVAPPSSSPRRRAIRSAISCTSTPVTAA